MKTQRWRERRDLYRPAGEAFRPERYDVAPIAEATAKAFVILHHYSASYPAARFRFGLFDRGELVGAAVFSHPCRDGVLTGVFGGPATDSVELGRFVLLDEVPGNAESWFLARTFEQLAGRVRGVLSLSDPMPRLDLTTGRLVTPGHVGTIYQAHNGRYLGRGQVRTLRLLPDGRTFSARAASKVRRLEVGYRYAAEVLERAGAAPLDLEDPAGWLAHWLPRLTRTVRHPGHHRYAWGLERRTRRALPASLPYPKLAPLFH